LREEGYVVLARGPWLPSAVRCRRVARAPARGAAAESVLAREWERALERARAAGQTLFPGPVYGLAAFRARGDELELDLHATDYREFVGTNLCPEYLALPKESAPRSDALGLSVLLLSGDTIVLHRRGAACFEGPLAIDTPGGHIDPGHHDDRGAPSPFLAALDELESELGVAASEVSELCILGLTRITKSEKPQVVLAARTALTPDEIRGRVGSARESFETNELWPVAWSEVARLDAECTTPAGRAAIRLACELLRG
jgi:hypothetical protein